MSSTPWISSTCHYRCTSTGKDGVYDGCYIACSDVEETLNVDVTLFQKKKISFVEGLKQLKRHFGAKAMGYFNFNQATGTVVTDPYEKLSVFIRRLIDEFDNLPSGNSETWFSFSQRKVWKILRFVNKILTESGSKKKFAVDDLYNSIYVSKQTGDLALAPSDDITFTEAKFNQMVLDTCSIMLLLGDKLPPEGPKPAPGLPFNSNDFPRSFRLYYFYLYCQNYRGLNYRGAFNPPIFWEFEKIRNNILASNEEGRNRPRYEKYFKGRIDRDWMKKIDPLTPLGSFYDKSFTLPCPPRKYKGRKSILRFFRNAIEHYFATINQMLNHVTIIELFDDAYDLTWLLFRVNVDYASQEYQDERDGGKFLSQLGYKF